MKKPLIILALSVCVPGATEVLAADPAPSADRVFRAGAATSNITPPLDTELIGGLSPRGATHIHDDLHVRCLALDDGRTQLAFAIVDNVQIPREVYDAARELIHEATGLPRAHVLMAATHTHSSPSLRGKSYTVLDEPLDDYQKFVIQRIADGVRRALNNLEPARIGWGEGEVPQHLFNRRWLLKDGQRVTSPFGDEEAAATNPGSWLDRLDKPAGPVNPKVYSVSVESKEGRPIALLANYWLHYVGGVGNGHISADYFGVFSERIGELLAEPGQDPPFVGIMSNGPSGDVNNNDYANYGKANLKRYEPYEKMREVAEDLAQEVLRVRQNLKHHDWVELGAAAEEVTLKTRLPSVEVLERSARILESARSEEEPSRQTQRESTFAQRALESADWPETFVATAQVFRIGDLGIAALPFEVFTETGLEIEERSPMSSTFTIELANGGLGYLPTPAQHELGGYETWLTVNRVEEQASVKLVNHLMELFEEVRRAERVTRE